MNRRLFGTDGVRGVANTYPMTPEVALRLGKALARTFRDTQDIRTVLIGKDTRLSGYILETALTSGICSMGLDVFLVGPLPTPAVAHLTTSVNANAGIMISASHNVAEDNGIKIFTETGVKLSDEKELEIEKTFFSDTIDEDHAPPQEIGKAYRLETAHGRYIEFAKATVGYKDLAGLKMVIDCANGAAYSVAPEIFQELGADLTVINDEPDGTNINLNCGALHLDHLKSKVIETGAQIGIAFDGDADRLMAVDERGEVIDGDQVMATLALTMKDQGRLANDTLVTTVMSNIGLKLLMRAHGINVETTQVGDRYVADCMARGGYNLGGEQSGHVIFRDHSPTGDGIITALQLLCIVQDRDEPVSEITSMFEKAPQSLVNVNVGQKKALEDVPAIMKAIAEAEAALGDTGRVLVRYSGTELLARVLVEGADGDQVKELSCGIAETLAAELGA